MASKTQTSRSLQRMVRPLINAGGHAYQNTLQVVRCTGNRKYGTPNTRPPYLSCPPARSGAAADGVHSQSNAGKLEQDRWETSKAAGEIPVSISDRIQAAGPWIEESNTAQIAIMQCSQGPRARAIAVMIALIPGWWLLEQFQVSQELRKWIWRLVILGPSLYFLSIPLWVQVPCEWWPNDRSSATASKGGSDGK